VGARASAAGHGKGACGASGNEDCEARETGTWQDHGWSLKAPGGTASSCWACWPCPPSFSAPARGERVIAQLLFNHNSNHVSSGPVCQALLEIPHSVGHPPPCEAAVPKCGQAQRVLKKAPRGKALHISPPLPAIFSYEPSCRVCAVFWHQIL